VQYYIDIHHTRIQDIHILLTELELNSQFGDISRFVEYGSTGKPESTNDPVIPEPDPPSPTEESSLQDPGLFLINLAVLAATTRLRVDPWNKTTGCTYN
jgi:hypothetical protein